MNFRNPHSPVSIYNAALAKLPHPPLASVNDVGIAARECNRAYPEVVAGLLEMHHWGLATKVEVLVASTEDPRGWGYVYTLPNDAANVVSLHMPSTQFEYGGERSRALLDRMNREFAVEGRLLFCNRANASARYVSYTLSEEQFTSGFVNAIALKLASELAMPITKRQDLRENFSNEFTTFLNQLLANEKNKAGQTYGDGPSDSEIVRAGGWL